MTQSSLPAIASCIADYDPDAMTVQQARNTILDYIEPIRSVERLAIRSALDRTLAADITSTLDVPGNDNSAMDGYALRGDDLVKGKQLTLRIVGSLCAGQRFTAAVGPGECVRIMTGAAMPADCDTVIAQELTESADAKRMTMFSDRVRRGDNRRLRGEDLRQGQIALSAGKILRPADIGMLASLGVAEVPVIRRLRVAFFSTGDELRSVGEALDPGCVYDSNRYTLYAMLKRLHCDIIDLGVVKDDPEAIETAYRSACESADAVITSGGVSVGAADYTRQTMTRLGDMLFWEINMRPGRPMAFGRITSHERGAYLFGLPGNPVAVMVSFYFLVRDALLRLSGTHPTPLPRLKAVSQSAIRKKPGRTEYQRGILAPDHDGSWKVRLTGAQGSGILRSMSEANCIIELGDAQGDVAAGDDVQVVLFDGLI